MKKVKTWWLLIVAGVLMISIGVFCFVNPFIAYIKLVKYSGFVLLSNGLLLLAVSAFHTHSRKERNWMLVECVTDLVFAMLLLFNPLFSFIAFPFFIGRWILSIGVIKMAASFALKGRQRGWGCILITGIMAMIFGLLIMYSPLIRSSDVTSLFGLFGLTIGALAIYDALRFRKMGEQLDFLF